MTQPISGLFIVPSDLISLERKGVLSGVLERTEKGFLSKAITIHPFTRCDRVVTLADGNIVYEYRQPESSRFRIVSWVLFLLHLLRVSWRIRRILQDEEITFVRAQDPYFSGLIGFLVSRYPRVPFCISIHSDYDKMFVLDPEFGAPKIFGSRDLAKKLERYLLKRADRVLAISDYIGAYAVRNGAARESLRVFRHILNLQRFLDKGKEAASQLLEFPDQKLIISAVCRLSRQKYVYDFLEMAKRLKSKRDDFVLVIAGGGEEEEELRRRIAAEDLSDVVILAGFLPQDAVAALRMRSVVNLCLLDGLSLIEACIAGRPIVAYDVEWHSEILQNNVTGLIVPEGATADLADAVRYLLDKPAEANRMGTGARNRAIEIFDPDKVRAARRSVYEELVGEFQLVTDYSGQICR